MARKPRILFVRPSSATFIEQDLRLLRKHYEVHTIDVGKGRSLGNRLRVLWRMFRGILWADLSYSWFAEIYALWAVRLSRLSARGSVVVIGGYEVAQVPEIGYGSALNPAARKMVFRILSKAEKSLAVSDFVRRSGLEICREANIEVVYNGIDTETLKPSRAKEAVVVTVGGATERTLVLKGIDTFVKASSKVPEAKFVVIGPNDEKVVKELQSVSPSVEFTGELPREKVVEWLDRAKVYCQLSRMESFGFALAEAMSLECCPVISDQGALPEIVGDSGFEVPYGDAEAAAEAIRNGLRSGDGRRARARVVEKFSIEERERRLCGIIDDMTA